VTTAGVAASMRSWAMLVEQPVAAPYAIIEGLAPDRIETS
jgi:hypothetical protein